MSAARLRLLVARAPASERRRVRERLLGQELVRTLGALRGIYAKLGQHLAMRPDLVPDEVREALTALEEEAPAAPFEAFRAALERALGPLRNRFAYIDPRPLASASIAQVHRARLRSGPGAPDPAPTPRVIRGQTGASPVVAVKVRHAELTPERLEADLALLRRAGRRSHGWLRRGLGGADPSAAIEAVAEALREELDFEREGRIAEEIAGRLADDPRIVVPRVHWQATARDVLTLDYVPRIRLDAAAKVRRAGATPEQCLAIVADAYGRQIFEHGVFHADPHPGNVFLVDESSPLAPPRPASYGGPRILFVDFGLSRRLSEELRSELRNGLHALLRRDTGELMEGLRRIGAVRPGREAEAEAALRAALEAGAADALSADSSAIVGLKELAKRLVRSSGAFRIPADLLLFARTLAHVFALAERVAPGTSPMPQLLPHLLRFLAGGPARTPQAPATARPVGSGASSAGRSVE